MKNEKKRKQKDALYDFLFEMAQFAIIGLVILAVVFGSFWGGIITTAIGIPLGLTWLGDLFGSIFGG